MSPKPSERIAATLGIVLMLALAALSLACGVAGAAQAVGTVQKVSGYAAVLRGGREPAQTLQERDSVDPRDTVFTGPQGRLELRMIDGSTLSLEEDTRLSLSQYVVTPEPSGLLDLIRGGLRSVVSTTFSRQRSSFKVRTQTAIVGVQGTDFRTVAEIDLTRIFVFSGVVEVIGLAPGVGGIQILRAGQSTVVRRGQAPETPRGDGSGAPASEAPPMATVVHIGYEPLHGVAMADQGTARVEVFEGMRLSDGDRLITGEGMEVELVYDEKCMRESHPDEAKGIHWACQDREDDDSDELYCSVHVPENSVYTLSDPNVCVGGLFLLTSGSGAIGAGAIGAGTALTTENLLIPGLGVVGATILIGGDDDEGGDDDGDEEPMSPE